MFCPAERLGVIPNNRGLSRPMAHESDYRLIRGYKSQILIKNYKAASERVESDVLSGKEGVVASVLSIYCRAAGQQGSRWTPLDAAIPDAVDMCGS